MEHLLNKFAKLIFTQRNGFFLILAYVSFLNFFVIKSTPEIIFLQFAVLVILLKRFRSVNFVKVWTPFIAVFLLYEFLRGYADNLAPFYNSTIYFVYNLEEKIFGVLPTILLQRVFPQQHWIVQLSVFFYSVFFYYSFLVAFLVWLKDEAKFKKYFLQFAFLTYISLLMFFLIPTAPPWFVASETGLSLSRYLTERSVLGNFAYVNIYHYFVYGNQVAALPSLHVAWPFFSTLFLVRNYNKWPLYLLFIVPLMIGFSIVLTGEHYIIDVLAGFLFAFLAVFGMDVLRCFRYLRQGRS